MPGKAYRRKRSNPGQKSFVQRYIRSECDDQRDNLRHGVLARNQELLQHDGQEHEWQAEARPEQGVLVDHQRYAKLHVLADILAPAHRSASHETLPVNYAKAGGAITSCQNPSDCGIAKSIRVKADRRPRPVAAQDSVTRRRS